MFSYLNKFQLIHYSAYAVQCQTKENKEQTLFDMLKQETENVYRKERIQTYWFCLQKLRSRKIYRYAEYSIALNKGLDF